MIEAFLKRECWETQVKEAFEKTDDKVILHVKNWDDIDFDSFNLLARQLSVNVSYGKVGDEEIVIIGKHLDDAVFDLDDQCPETDAMPQLLKLKERFPKLKVTLFCIPSKGTKEYFESLKKDWIELAVHGWFHDTEHGNATECNHWTEEEAHKYLEMAEEMGFVKGFRAPGWQLNHETVKVLAERGYWLADHLPVEQYKEIKLPRYTTNHLWEVHGHTFECNMNGIEELSTTKCNFSEKTNFHFVSEQLNSNNYIDASK